MNGYCDVYVYESSNGGWTTHVAQSRRPLGAPMDGMDFLNACTPSTSDEGDNHPALAMFTEASKIHYDWLQQTPSNPIPHEDAGQCYNHDTPGECADNLERLAAAGFIVPLEAINALRIEQAEMDKK